MDRVGGNDDLIFDWPQQRVRCRGADVRAGQRFFWWLGVEGGTGTIAEEDFTPEAEIWAALVLGVQDYARKIRRRAALQQAGERVCGSPQ